MNGVKVSILVPCYNVEKYLDQCIESIIKQTYKNLEIICVNDGSTDNTLQILYKYSNKDSRIKIIDKSNSGYGASMNQALAIATGEYIGIVESDDFIEPIMIERLFRLAKDNDLDIARGCYYEYSTKFNKNNIIHNDFVPKNRVLEPLFDQSPFYQAPSIWASLYRRSMLIENRISFLETPGASFQDTSFAFKTYCCAKRFMMINDGLLHYRIDNESSSVNNPAKVYCVCDEYKEMWSFANENPKRFELIKNTIPILQLGTYSWNYNRLSSGLRKEFKQEWSKELRILNKEKLIPWSAFHWKKRFLLFKIAYLPFLINDQESI